MLGSLNPCLIIIPMLASLRCKVSDETRTAELELLNTFYETEADLCLVSIVYRN